MQKLAGSLKGILRCQLVGEKGRARQAECRTLSAGTYTHLRVLG